MLAEALNDLPRVFLAGGDKDKEHKVRPNFFLFQGLFLQVRVIANSLRSCRDAVMVGCGRMQRPSPLVVGVMRVDAEPLCSGGRGLLQQPPSAC